MGRDERKKWTRRGFLQRSIAFGYAVFASGLPIAETDQSNPSDASKVRLAREASDDWYEPETIWSKENGELEVNLRIDFFDRTINDVPLKLRLYESTAVSETGKTKPGITGPTLRFKKGSSSRKLIAHLKNDLPAFVDQSFCHHSHWTNLHAHGLHVSPEEGDNVFLQIGDGAPDGQEKDLIYQIPDDHHPGTFWYHPHKHGSVALQVGNGLAGALIIEGDIDEVPEIAAAKERLFVFQQIPYNEISRTVECDDRWDIRRHVTTINGQVKPKILMQPGEVQRWRFIHAGVKEKLRVGLNGHKLHVIAYDGITSGYMASNDYLELFPGYRADVLVQARDNPDTYFLEDVPETSQSGLLGPELKQRLANVLIQGKSKPMQLPDPSVLAGLCPMKDLSGEPVNQKIELGFNFKAEAGVPKFQICWPEQNAAACDRANCKTFENHAEPIQLKLDTVDEWKIVTCNTSPKPPHHPFHIHVNPFQIISINGVPRSPGQKIYGDTLIVNRNEPVVLRMNYRRFTGMSVLHCHILDHEDQGMMIKVNIGK